MNNLEKIEAYFNNELNDSEKNDFLNEVESNSEIKKEFTFQKEVVNGIKEARKAELKAMLNRVSISTVSTASSGLYKFMYGGVATILVGTALWYYSNSENIDASAPNTRNEIAELVVEDEINADVSQPTTKLPIKEKRKEKETQKTEANNTIKSTTVITPNVPTSEDNFDSGVAAEENLEVPKAISNTSINISSKVNVEVKLKKKYEFHYQYSDKGIVLYGDFKEGLFEILELNKEASTKYYLFYKANYYYINDRSGKITPLNPVKEKNLQIKLEALR